MNGIKVGHIKKGEAAKLAPLLKQMKNITVTAIIPSPGTHGSMPVTVNLVTTSSRPLSNFELEPIYMTITRSLHHHFHRTKKAPNLSRVTPSPTEMNRAPLQALTTGLANIASTSEEDQKPKAREDTNTSSPDRATSLQALTAGLAGTKPSLQELTAGLADTKSDLQVEMTTVDWEDAHQQLDEMFDQQTENRLEQLPNYSMPPQLHSLELFDYHKDGIRWLIHQERNESALPPFIKEIFPSGQKRWLCTITRAVFLKPPKPICGGVLADGTWLKVHVLSDRLFSFSVPLTNFSFFCCQTWDWGTWNDWECHIATFPCTLTNDFFFCSFVYRKTIQTIGLILSNPPPGQSYPFVARVLSAKPAPRCTLIICPLTVISNWKIQISKFVNGRVDDKVVKLRIYHGKPYDIVPGSWWWTL
jgi:hypothetical protein